MITVLFTTAKNETAGIVLYDGGSIVRHSNERDEYEHGYVVVEGALYEFPIVPDDLNRTLYLAERYFYCVYLYLENKHCFVNKDKLWSMVCQSMHTEDMSVEDKTRFSLCFPHEVK